MFHRVSGARLAALLALGTVLGSLSAHASTSDQKAVDAFRRLVFMLNLDPPPWDHVSEEINTISAWAETQTAETAADFPIAAQALLERLARERSISLPTRVMQNQVGKELIEAAAAAFAMALQERLEASEGPDADLAGVRELWRAFETEVAWSDPEAAARFRAFLHGVGDGPSDPRALQALREYVQANFLTHFRLVYHGAFRPVPMSGHGKGLGPISKPPLPPGTVLNPDGARVLADLRERYGDWRDESLGSFEVGLIAFHDPSIFAEPGRSSGMSCASCHLGTRPNRAFFIPGLSNRPGNADVTNSHFARFNNNNAFDPLDIPGLEGIRHTGPFGRNARFETLAEVVRNVIVMEFGGEEPSDRLVEGIVAFLESFDFEENAHITDDGRLTPAASETVKRGETLFNQAFGQMEGRSCASCHIPNSYFLDRQKHDIGTVPPGSPYAPDGKLDTPTLLGSARSAPYMHDGRHATLGDVVVWFNARYGLDLEAEDLSALTAYVELIGGAEASE